MMEDMCIILAVVNLRHDRNSQNFADNCCMFWDSFYYQFLLPFLVLIPVQKDNFQI